MQGVKDTRTREEQVRDESHSGDRPARGASPPQEPPTPAAKNGDKEPPLWNNVITYVGLFAAQLFLILLVTFWLFTLVSKTTNPYVDVVGYMVLPGALICSLLTVPVGILFKSWRLRRRNPHQRLRFQMPRFDFEDPHQRRVAIAGAIGTALLLPIVGVSGYHGYHYTDSASFCSDACHKVMEPQATAYEHSAHARVSCAECHIGSGASWFVRSKLSGTRQVLATWRESYSRPIPPAIHHLRPARETCERCHWPKKFFGEQLKEITHFASDEANTRRVVDMLLKTGGGDESIGRSEGIHMHMTLAGNIDYVATDAKLQVIPWVRTTDKSGAVLVYRSDGLPASDPPPAEQVRRLDCMDCHNRPAHKFRSPQEAVDLGLEVGRIDPGLPFIKREAVAALVREYEDQNTAQAQIGASLTEFYRTKYPDLFETRKAAIFQAIDHVREIYRACFFPVMKVDWRTYPDNIGHMISNGCMRCHDGLHVNQNGKRISHECSTCHTFLNRDTAVAKDSVIRQGEFIHPYKLEGKHASLNCSECHTGGTGPQPNCAACHTTQRAFRDGTSPSFQSFGIKAAPMSDAVDCDGCHDLSKPTTVAVINGQCMECHSDEQDKYEGMLSSWKAEAEQLLTKAAQGSDASSLRLLAELRAAGPLHNIEATRAIVNGLSSGRSSTAAAAQSEKSP